MSIVENQQQKAKQNLGVRVDSLIIDSITNLQESSGKSRTEIVESALNDKFNGNMSQDLQVKLKIANDAVDDLRAVFIAMTKKTGKKIKYTRVLSMSISNTQHRNFKKFSVLCNMSMSDIVREISSNEELQKMMFAFMKLHNEQILSSVISVKDQKSKKALSYSVNL